jgi:hypothetical protein
MNCLQTSYNLKVKPIDTTNEKPIDNLVASVE